MLKVSIWFNTLIVLFVAAAVALNHYNINLRVESLTRVEDMMYYAHVSQEIAQVQTRRVERLEKTIAKYSEVLHQTQLQYEAAEKAVMVASEQLKNLIDDNSKLEHELDAASKKLAIYKAELDAALKKLKEKEAELNEALINIEEMKCYFNMQ